MRRYRVTMSDVTPDRAWAGLVTFPRTTAELRSVTVCPACLTPLTSTVCRSCGLDLRHPASTELAAASVTIADALDARLDIIGRIRRETAAAAISAPAAVAAVAPTQAPAQAPVASAVEQPRALAAPTATAGSRRSGIQIALIVVGISLLSVFAVFGLVFAFVTYGSDVRMAIIVVGTIATMIAAVVLARRGLTSTAEGLAALGTVMLVLDAWALRLNDPSGLGVSAEQLYWGVALLIVGSTAALWSRLSSLGIPAVVSAGLLPFGAALVTGHFVDELLPAIGGAAASASALAALITAAFSWAVVSAIRVLTRRVAQCVALAVGAIAGSVGLASLVVLDPEARYSPAIAGFVLGAAALLHVLTLAPSMRRARVAALRRPLDNVVLAAIGSGAALALVVGAVIAAVRFDQDRVIVSAPLIAATAVAALVEQGWRRSAHASPWRTTFFSAAITAAVLAAIAGGLTAIVASAAFVEAGTQGLEFIPLGIGDAVSSSDRATVAALGALGFSLGLVALSWATLGVLVRRARALTLIAGIVIIAAVPLLPAWWVVMTVFAIFALGGALGLHATLRAPASDARRALIALCIPLTTGAALGAFFTGWGVSRGWIVGLVIALLTIVIARPATTLVPLRAAFMAVATALVLGSMPELAADLASVAPALQVSAGSVVLVGAAVVVASSQWGSLAALERQVVGAIAVAAALIATTVTTLPGLDEAIALGLLAAALVLVVARASTIERLIACALLPLAVARGAVLSLDSGPLAEAVRDPALVAVVALAALVVVAVVGLLTTPAGASFARVVGDIAATVSGVVLVTTAAANNVSNSQLWFTVLTLAVLVLVTAISRDGLIGSSSPRRFAGWVALGIATIGLWMRLADARETAPEPYVVPLAGALLLIVAVHAWLGRRRGAGALRSAAPLTAAALLIALVPSALQSVDGADIRGVVVALVAVTLVVAPLLAERRLDVALVGMGTALVGAGLATLTVLALAHTVDLIVATGDTALDGSNLLRAALVVMVLCVVAVTARLLAEGRLRDIAPIAALGVAALCAAALALSSAVDPVELVSVPLALALLAIGTLHLGAEPTARSWLWLAPGFVALLVPSLLAIDGAAEPLWRAVALGVSALCVFVGGLWRRLQAPFVIGATVLLIHLLVQAWPLLQQVGSAVEWWLWLGLAGVLVVVLAARYERRLHNVRNVATRIAQLR